MSVIERVHLIAKTHLDLGFTGLASEVVARYQSDFFPRALALSAELRAAGGPERLIWTTGSWLIWDALERGSPDARRRIERGIAEGDLCWHALPFTLHTELADAGLVRSGLGISAELDDRFGRRTIAAKMSDVPGHTRGIVPLLAEAGVRFLHIGVNPACPMPAVPPVFRWRSPDGAEVVVMYHGGGYGGFQSVDGFDEAIMFLHAGDNLGPPTREDVQVGYTAAARLASGAEIAASTIDAFAASLLASEVIDDLPLVTAEIGDTWIHGGASDPQKLARFRTLLSARTAVADCGRRVDRALLPVVEHTWGLDEKITLHDTTRWTGEDLAELRAEPATVRFEESWAEQRAYLDDAEAALRAERGDDVDRLLDERLASLAPARPVVGSDGRGGFEPQVAGDPVEVPGWALRVDPGDGAITTLVHRGSGRALADATHPLARLSYQTFSAADYDRFHAVYNCAVPEDEWWAILDYTKPGIESAGAVSARWPATVVGQWCRAGESHTSVLVRSTFAGAASASFGASAELWTRIDLGHDGRRVGIDVAWFAKPLCRLPEATWCSFVPAVAEPHRWTFDKLGQDVSPLDVVSRGGRSLHAVGQGARYDGPDGPLTLVTEDAALVAPGRPALLEFTDEVPDLSGGLHVLLHDNVWGTNFPMWNGGDARFRFALSV